MAKDAPYRSLLSEIGASFSRTLNDCGVHSCIAIPGFSSPSKQLLQVIIDQMQFIAIHIGVYRGLHMLFGDRRRSLAQEAQESGVSGHILIAERGTGHTSSLNVFQAHPH